MLGEGHKPSILIVDDAPTNIQVLAETLRGDYRIKVATSGQAALDIVDKEGSKPDLILLDVMMAEMDGYEVCRRLKANPDSQGIPVIFVTARSEAQDEEYGLALGAMDYITKPFRPAVVKARVHNHIKLKLKQRQNEFLASAIKLSSLAFVAAFPDGRLGFANDAFERLTGYSGDELLFNDWERTLTPAAWQDIRQEKQEELQRTGQPVQYEKELMHKNGSTIPVEVRVHLAKDADGRPQYRYFFLTDISERKLTAAALQEREEQLGLFVDHAPASIAMFDKQMRYLAVSHRWADDFGLTGQDLIGRSHYEMLPNIPERWREVHRRCLAGATERSAADLFERADGSQQWLRWEVRPWKEAAGSIGGILIFTEDITELNQQRIDLAQAKAEAERANAAKSHFLAAASHDLRQPLHALDIYVRLIAGSVPPASAGLVGKMQQCSDTLSALLNDLLDLSKLDAGAVEPRVSLFPLAEFLNQIATTHEPSAQQKGLLFRVASTRLMVMADDQLLRQLVANLVANAIRYTERGGVLVGARRRDGKLWIEVWDTGIGIPTNQHREIFEPFRQLGNPARDQEHGTGLGLALVQRLAKVLGLQIRVSSHLGRGSLFAIEVPRGTIVADSEATERRIVPERQRLRIALVEDQAFVRDATTQGLQHLGHEVVAGEDVAELLTGLNGSAPDVIVADYRLKGGSTGSDAIAVVRQHYGKHIGAVIITGETAPEVIRSIVDSRLRVLYKPVQLDQLQICLDELGTASPPHAA